MERIRSLGIMSGSSCDGLDLAICEFEINTDHLDWKLIQAATLEFPEEIIKDLKSQSIKGEELAILDFKFGRFIAQQITSWLKKIDMEIDLISSHGHTMFHQPAAGFGCQIGSGAVIAALTGIDTISDFRSADIALGGEGAPLVPIGDLQLYPEYDAWLNLGGIANITIRTSSNANAFDIGPCNMILNHFAEKNGQAYDEDGAIARSGNVNSSLLNKLQSLDYFKINERKSLGREWIFENYLPILDSSGVSDADCMATTIQHLIIEIKKVLTARMVDDPAKRLLVSGGGTFNIFLIEKMKSDLNLEIIIPDENTINFKEAIVFAYLGALRFLEKPNVLGSLTGAGKDHCAGSLHKGS